MNEVTRIHLGRQPFVISVDAKRELRRYLDDIAKQPGVQPEVVNEIELRMAELLAEHGIHGEKVILPEDITFLKSQLGEAGDFKDEDGAAEPERAADNKEHAASGNEAGKDEDTAGPKKLFRDTDDAWLGGVASGLAAYTGIDVLIVRILFVLSIFLSGAGIIAYVLIWLFAPEAKTPSDRLRMRGKAVTIDSLKDMVERADLAGASERASQNFGRALGKCIELFAKVILMIIGSVFVTAGIITMLWSMAAGVYLLIHGGQIGTEIAFPIGSREVWLTVLAMVTLVLLGFFILMSGLAMTTRKWRLPTWSVVTLISIFMVSGGIAGALAADTVPHIRERYRQAHHTENRSLAPFNTVRLQGEDTVYRFVPAATYYVEFEYLGKADTAALRTTVGNGELAVDSGGFMRTSLCTGLCFYSDHDLKITIHAPRLDQVAVEGTDNTFVADTRLQQDTMQLLAKRDSGSSFSLSYADAGMVRYLDSLKGDAGWHGAALSGIKQTDRSGVLSYHDDGDTLHVRAADDFVFNADKSCDESDPIVFLGEPVRSVTIREKRLTSAEELRKLRSPDEASTYNCVVQS